VEPLRLNGIIAGSNVAPIVPRHRKESAMDWNRVEGNWKQLKGKIKEQWGHLTDDDLDKIAGHPCTHGTIMDFSLSISAGTGVM
jgi:CsbD-like